MPRLRRNDPSTTLDRDQILEAIRTYNDLGVTPGRTLLHQRTGVSRWRIQAAVAELRREGLIECVPHVGCRCVTD